MKVMIVEILKVTFSPDTVQRVLVEPTRVVCKLNNRYDNNSRDNESSYSLMNASKKYLPRKGITSAIFDCQSKCILACLKLDTCHLENVIQVEWQQEGIRMQLPMKLK